MWKSIAIMHRELYCMNMHEISLTPTRYQSSHINTHHRCGGEFDVKRSAQSDCSSPAQSHHIILLQFLHVAIASLLWQLWFTRGPLESAEHYARGLSCHGDRPHGYSRNPHHLLSTLRYSNLYTLSRGPCQCHKPPNIMDGMDLATFHLKFCHESLDGTGW